MRNDPKPRSAAQMPKASSDAGQGGIPLWAGWVLLGAAAMTAVGQVVVSANRALTPLETGLFNVLLFVFGLVGSVAVSGYYARKQTHREVEQARAEYRQLARPALRRVVAIASSTSRVAGQIADRHALLRETTDDELSTAVTTEWVAGLQGQMNLVGDHLAAAITDWRELLPEEFAKAEEQARQDAEATRADLALAKKEIEDKSARIHELEQADDPTATQELERLRRQVEELQSEGSALARRADYTGLGRIKVSDLLGTPVSYTDIKLTESAPLKVSIGPDGKITWPQTISLYDPDTPKVVLTKPDKENDEPEAEGGLPAPGP